MKPLELTARVLLDDGKETTVPLVPAGDTIESFEYTIEEECFRVPPSASDTDSIYEHTGRYRLVLSVTALRRTVGAKEAE